MLATCKSCTQDITQATSAGSGMKPEAKIPWEFPTGGRPSARGSVPSPLAAAVHWTPGSARGAGLVFSKATKFSPGSGVVSTAPARLPEPPGKPLP